ncbi:MAG: YmdB family metallophosphoesterase [Prosthecobacter sp.]|uniref:YmdB family metallophosphoesterase n=1 Tax=Prosthecobacter sp. TaxID=1965333 RepID=UPI0038FD4570
MGWHLDGKVSAVIGTHTHVPTADERVLPKGTAFQSDASMCGPMDSVIGSQIEPVLERFHTMMPTRFGVGRGRGAELHHGAQQLIARDIVLLDHGAQTKPQHHRPHPPRSTRKPSVPRIRC